MSASPVAVETSGLGRDYGSTVALDALDLRVPQGSMVGLLGPNGAGKTTAMLLLATLLAPSRGQGLVFGHDLARNRADVRRRLGLVFQEPSVDGLLTVEENLRFAAGLAGLGGAAARTAVAKAIERAGLTAHASRPARELSGGWRRLTDIARATLHGPPLLIFDEPTVGLDPEHRERMWRLLDGERRERGTTVIFSTHYLAEAEPADAVVLLAHGRVVANDAPAALVSGVGHHVLEIEGLDADEAARALDAMGAVRLTVWTDRGCRLGVKDGFDDLATVARLGRRLTRVTRRAASLEDVYFALTQPVPARAVPPKPS